MTDTPDNDTSGATAPKQGLHPRNRFRTRYDFAQLIKGCPALAAFVSPNAHSDESVDYANPAAVVALNQALLKQAYGLQHWEVPPGHLCPPIPGRSDYIHHLADLLSKGPMPPKGRSVRILDIGTGANCIYPIIGANEYGWRFVGTETDPAACRWARKLVVSNKGLSPLIEVRTQTSASECFKGVVKPGEVFAASMCNPPFHSSAAEAAASSQRKVHHLSGKTPQEPPLNFGGKNGELWCEGGELAFVRRMISQSAAIPGTCLWFTSLVSKSAHLQPLQRYLRQAGAAGVKIIDMAQGQKKSRILAWTFLTPGEG